MGSKNKPIDEINLDVVVGIDIENISLILFKSGFMSFLFIFVFIFIFLFPHTLTKIYLLF